LSDSPNKPSRQELLDLLDTSRKTLEEISDEELESISGGGIIKSATQLLKMVPTYGKNTFTKVGSDTFNPRTYR
jgi:bacteriocin-like protein